MSGHRFPSLLGSGLSLILLTRCGGSPITPFEASDAASIQAAWGPETPNFNLEVILQGSDNGFGHVKFRQPNDDVLIIHLDTWVRDLSPNHDYRLQRATDGTVDDDCTGQNWLTLGEGLTPKAITTDDRGTGRAALWRSVAAFPVGSTFDIHFRIIDDATQAMALESGCYQFTISQ